VPFGVESAPGFLIAVNPAAGAGGGRRTSRPRLQNPRWSDDIEEQPGRHPEASRIKMDPGVRRDDEQQRLPREYGASQPGGRPRQTCSNRSIDKPWNADIPAKAGIHSDGVLPEASRIKMDRGFRRDDEQERLLTTTTRRSLGERFQQTSHNRFQESPQRRPAGKRSSLARLLPAGVERRAPAFLDRCTPAVRSITASWTQRPANSLLHDCRARRRAEGLHGRRRIRPVLVSFRTSSMVKQRERWKASTRMRMLLVCSHDRVVVMFFAMCIRS
jgi:hypothetical protein